jgi:hypothetical protein
MSQVKVSKIGQDFFQGTYNAISVLVRKSDGYVNATKIAGDNKKDINQYFRWNGWKSIVEHWKGLNGEEAVAMYVLITGFTRETYGSYVHPDLVHFVCEWCDIGYAFQVQKIMNGIDGIVHASLKEKGLEDNKINATPFFQEIVELFGDLSNHLYDFCRETSMIVSKGSRIDMFRELGNIHGKVMDSKKKMGEPSDSDEEEEEEEDEDEDS